MTIKDKDTTTVERDDLRLILWALKGEFSPDSRQVQEAASRLRSAVVYPR